MRLKKRKTGSLGRPSSGLTFGMIGWVFVSCAMMIGLVVAASELGAQLQLPRAQTFGGEMRAVNTSTSLILPQGLVLEEVVVSEGDLVRAGQTIAVFDVSRLQDRLMEIDVELTALDVSVACLRAERVKIANLPSAPKSSFEIAAQDALQECRLFREEHRLEIEMLRAELNVLTEQQGLLQHKIKLAPGPTRADDVKWLEALLSASMASSRLDERIVNLTRRLKRAALEKDKQRALRLRQIQLQKSNLDQEKRRIESAVQVPRLSAPEDGRIGRVRSLPPGFFAQQDTLFSSVHPEDPGGYQAFFSLPLSLQDKIAVGTKVRIRVLGWAGPEPMLDGRVVSILPPAPSESSDLLRAEVRLSANSERAIETAGARLALQGDGTASVLKVSLTEETLGTSISRIFAKDFASGDGVLHRLLKEVKSGAAL